MDLWTLLEWIGRILFVALFVISGIGHLVNHKGTTAYAQSKGVPLAGAAVAVTGVMLLLGALAVLSGHNVDWGAGLLVLFLVPTAFVMHNFWNETDPMMKANQSAHFWKNLALAGAALLLLVAQRQG
ncbi:MAG TPA: DoxX family protein [Gemmatimonadales bacterium]|nr:DoxX family protein [Gemmatimonadales bacterium]